MLVLVGCQRASLSPAEYMAWVEDKDNGMIANKDLDDFEYSLLYKPLDYVLAKEESSGILKKEQIEQRRNELGAMQYFTLKITAKNAKELLRAGITSEDQYYQRLEYFMSYMQNDTYLIEGKDTLPCLLFHFERNYGLAPYNTFVLGYAGSKEKQITNDKVFVYDDKILGTGKVMMTVQAKDIEKAPNIIWN
ncbi:MAG: hypothetical protein JST26_07975 [Bacteroidetes bacterium]|nr:hypothetical protein [Bacteroidota bacterium]